MQNSVLFGVFSHQNNQVFEFSELLFDAQFHNKFNSDCKFEKVFGVLSSKIRFGFGNFSKLKCKIKDRLVDKLKDFIERLRDLLSQILKNRKKLQKNCFPLAPFNGCLFLNV